MGLIQQCAENFKTVEALTLHLDTGLCLDDKSN